MAHNYAEGWPALNPQAPADSLEAKQKEIDNGTDRIDPSRYYTQAFMEREWERLWPRAWLIAGVATDLRESGDYFTFELGRESILVVRGEDDRVRAFYNVCPHRGNRIVHTAHGSVPRFTCSFHSWQFCLDGKLARITDEETFRGPVIAHRPGLNELRCEVHAGLVFINMNRDAPPLRECLGLPPGYLEAYHLDEMCVVHHVRTEWASNWKTGVDAFYETYHLHAVHPQTNTVMDDLGVQHDLYPNGASRMIVPLAKKSPRVDDQQSVDAGLQYMLQDAGVDPQSYRGNAAQVRTDIQAAKRARARKLGLDYSDLVDGQLTDSWATGIFPNVQIGLHAEGAFLMRFLPHPTDPERFYYDTQVLLRPADDPNYKVPDWMGVPPGTDCSGRTRPVRIDVPAGEPPGLGQVLDQDSELLPVVQSGIRSRGFHGPLWSEQEQRLRHFHKELDRYLNGEK
jgi:phenylpropionate dioxygenase-like ring-hydroxylating dioxygenase large terminal subunit